jgi:cytoplasmic iron level regulating protein YaaA (DUF328/UPF0246 family)
MKILLSPAKSLDWENSYPEVKTSVPQLLDNANYLATKLEKLSVRQVKKLMDLSDNLAQLNVDRFQELQKYNHTRPALFAFDGDVYKGLDATNLSPEALDRAESQIRILSGLYGILRPFDNIMPYRLEMGTSLKITPAKTNLYKYWGDTVVNTLKAELDEPNELIVNAASIEYAKVIVGVKNHGLNLLNVEFKEKKGDNYKVVSFFAKKARGLFAKFCLEADPKDRESLKDFNFEGYQFNSELSTDNNFTYTRE